LSSRGKRARLVPIEDRGKEKKETALKGTKAVGVKENLDESTKDEKENRFDE